MQASQLQSFRQRLRRVNNQRCLATAAAILTRRARERRTDIRRAGAKEKATQRVC